MLCKQNKKCFALGKPSCDIRRTSPERFLIPYPFSANSKMSVGFILDSHAVTGGSEVANGRWFYLQNDLSGFRRLCSVNVAISHSWRCYVKLYNHVELQNRLCHIFLVTKLSVKWLESFLTLGKKYSLLTFGKCVFQFNILVKNWTSCNFVVKAKCIESTRLSCADTQEFISSVCLRSGEF